MTRSEYGQKRVAKEPEDGNGREFPAIAPNTGAKIVKRERHRGVSADPQERTKGVEIVGGPKRTEQREGVKRVSRDQGS